MQGNELDLHFLRDVLSADRASRAEKEGDSEEDPEGISFLAAGFIPASARSISEMDDRRAERCDFPPRCVPA